MGNQRSRIIEVNRDADAIDAPQAVAPECSGGVTDEPTSTTR